jgi:GT2 family glycosyltransferase
MPPDGSAADCLATVVVVNFNGLRHLADCLTALERQTLPRHRYEVLLIDNASADGSVEFVRTQFPYVRVLALRKNFGFVGANNLALRLARGRDIVLLNNDTRADPGWLEALLTAARTGGERVGGVTSRILFRDDPTRINSTGLVLYRDGRAGDRDLGRTDGPAVRVPDEVFGGCGASLLLTRALLDDIGGLDPKLFMYYEDLDLAWRAQLRGWRFLYAPDSVVEHVCGGQSAPASPLLVRQIERNRALVNLQNAPLFLAIFSLIGLLLRFGRLGLRFLTARRRYQLRTSHLQAMASAVAAVVAWLPATLLSRYEIRVARRLRPDRAVHRFVRLPPPGSAHAHRRQPVTHAEA